MASRNCQRVARLSQRFLSHSARSSLPCCQAAVCPQTVPGTDLTACASNAAYEVWSRGFAAGASPPKVDKPSGEEIGHDSPYDKPKAGKEAEGNPKEIPWDPEHVNIGNECDKILLHSAEMDGIPGILKEIETHGMTFNDNNIATAFEQLSLQKGSLSEDEMKNQVFETAGFKHLVNMATEETDNFNPRQLADIVASLGKLRFQDAGLLGNLIARTARKVGEMDAEHLSKLVTIGWEWALEQAAKRPS
ncbi:hypothetical protein WJX74_002384 [Apatococcus lobatus]|uniref:Uncharacterized protein n=1 Tax=Apatococcus lobatus TaxID=904363 RepID=A0AAW1SAG0_9CHLO